jgi:hypothetical protein
MENLFAEAAGGAIILVGIGVMTRLIQLRTAVILIVIVSLAFIFAPVAVVAYSENIVPHWVFWGAGVIIGVNLLRGVIYIFFGRNVADAFTARLLFSIFTPILNLINATLRRIFRFW